MYGKNSQQPYVLDRNNKREVTEYGGDFGYYGAKREAELEYVLVCLLIRILSSKRLLFVAGETGLAHAKPGEENQTKELIIFNIRRSALWISLSNSIESHVLITIYLVVIIVIYTY